MMKSVVGIDLGGMSAKAAVMLPSGGLSPVRRTATSISDSPRVTAERLARLAGEAVSAAGLSWEEIGAVGVGSPGVIESGRGTVVRWPNFGWENVPLAELMEGSLPVSVYVTNDANAAALGEAVYGSGKRYRSSVTITLGTGIGGGIILDGKLVEGFRSAGGEPGHMVIRRGGIPCTCGRRGCFECYASATALKRETAKAMLKDPASLLWKEAASPEEVTGRTAFDAAARGDKSAKRVIKRYVENLGEGIVDLANLLRPEVIILGGGISGAGEALLAPLRKFVGKYLFAPAEIAPLEIVTASLGNDAGIYGAAEYARTRIGHK